MAYQPGDTLIRAVMTSFTGLPEDQVVNTFNFTNPTPPTVLEIQAMFNWVDRFYNVVGANLVRVSEWISDYVSRSSTHLLQAYKIVDGPSGSPLLEEPWLGPGLAGSSQGSPSEVAAVLSYHADLTDVPEEVGLTRPRARRRGRLYVGPLTNAAIDISAPPYLLKSITNDTLRQAAVRLFDDAGGKWCVHSRTDKTLYPVTAGWTDNAPDTQRRRGPDATARVAWIG